MGYRSGVIHYDNEEHIGAFYFDMQSSPDAKIPEESMSVADVVTADCDHDGCAEVIERYFL